MPILNSDQLKTLDYNFQGYPYCYISDITFETMGYDSIPFIDGSETVEYCGISFVSNTLSEIIRIRKVLISGVWKDVSEINILINGVWKTATNIYILVSGTWRNII